MGNACDSCEWRATCNHVLWLWADSRKRQASFEGPKPCPAVAGALAVLGRDYLAPRDVVNLAGAGYRIKSATVNPPSWLAGVCNG